MSSYYVKVSRSNDDLRLTISGPDGQKATLAGDWWDVEILSPLDKTPSRTTVYGLKEALADAVACRANWRHRGFDVALVLPEEATVCP